MSMGNACSPWQQAVAVASHGSNSISCFTLATLAHHQLHVLLPQLYQLHVLFIQSSFQLDYLHAKYTALRQAQFCWVLADTTAVLCSRDLPLPDHAASTVQVVGCIMLLLYIAYAVHQLRRLYLNALVIHAQMHATN